MCPEKAALSVSLHYLPCPEKIRNPIPDREQQRAGEMPQSGTHWRHVQGDLRFEGPSVRSRAGVFQASSYRKEFTRWHVR
jgi:hypothetical protein